MLILLALLGLGAVAAYELSPKAKGWVDEHVKTIEEALVAHKTADHHLESAAALQQQLQQLQQNWEVITQHVLAADALNKVAAQKTAQVAPAARTDQERKVVAQSAAGVIDREKKIAAALQQFGGGQCDARRYPKVSARTKDALLAKLKSEGMSVTGSNPWEIDTHKYDVMLRALWEPSTETLHLIVTSGKGGFLGLVTCDEIWAKIEPILKGIIGS